MNFSDLGLWAAHLVEEPSCWNGIKENVEAAYAASTVYPAKENLFAAFQATPPRQVRVVILGQDPYHEPHQAHGLSFSVEKGVAIPKSLRNIYKELESDLGITPPDHGDLRKWAKQGVLLLNSVLTVEAHKAGSHRSFGWETFTDEVISSTNALPQPIVFILWGAYAQKKAALIQTDAPRLILTSAHPSPLSAYRGFFGSRPFSKANEFLRQQGCDEIDFSL